MNALLGSSPADGWEVRRRRMVEEQLRFRGIRDARVLAAFLRVPRHEFVAEQYRTEAYEDHPLPIGHGQTISQPYIVAAMLETLRLQPTDRALEVGAGSGYQTALLAELCAEVFAVERHQALAESARAELHRLDYRNAHLIVGDGTLGYATAAPFDAIVVAAAAATLPPALLAQLGEGGRMIIPVGTQEMQELELVTKREGTIHRARLDGCRFVPLIGTGGFSE
jgi:protein-L-isoaspartate(D-aspartate) O-methyltransferase